jgi:hypothetical protein
VKTRAEASLASRTSQFPLSNRTHIMLYSYGLARDGK